MSYPERRFCSTGRSSIGISKLPAGGDAIGHPQTPFFIASTFAVKTGLVAFFDLNGLDQLFFGKANLVRNIPSLSDLDYFLHFHVDPSPL